MFGKAKYAADGTFDKFKSRIVAGGHLQDREIYNNGSSPTPSTTSVFIIAAIAAKEDRAVATIDFPGAFLNSDMPQQGDHVVYMRINKYLTNVLISINKSYKKFQNSNGTCVVKLKKALYGCVESAKMWYDKISNDFIKLGYTANPTDMYREK
jgi:Reverse transcriptase (RNA-dependent DNA polymerase)